MLQGGERASFAGRGGAWCYIPWSRSARTCWCQAADLPPRVVMEPGCALGAPGAQEVRRNMKPHFCSLYLD